MWRGFQSGVMALLFRSKRNREIDEELEGFLEHSAAEKRRLGMSDAAARRASRAEMGSRDAVRQMVWASRWEAAMDGVMQDLRLAARVLLKSPGFALVAIVSLALGIGANTAIFTLAKHVLVDRLPVRHAEELRMLLWRSGHEQLVPPVWGDLWSTDDGGLASNVFSYPVIEANLPLPDVRTMEERIRGTMGQQEMFARLTTGFGVLALVLAAVGVYGVLSYAVALRTGEIGIRMALGAAPKAVRSMVLLESLGLLALGVSVGLPLTLLLTQVVRSQLYGLGIIDPLSVLAAVAVVGAVTVVAAWLPARRAAKVDPMVALRWE